MKASIKRAWIEALRSGKFEQGKNLLGFQRTDGSREYCCLGVLCMVQGAEPKLRNLDYSHGTLEFGQSENVELEEVLPLATAIETGLYEDYGASWMAMNPTLAGVPNMSTFKYPASLDLSISLAHCNDAGFTFAQIADLIEYFIPETADDAS